MARCNLRRIRVVRTGLRLVTTVLLTALCGIAQAPGQLQLLGQGREGRAPGVDGRRARIEDHPHEEAIRLLVVELLGVEDVGAALEQQGRDVGHDAAAVGAGKGQDHRGLPLASAGLAVKLQS